MRLVLFTVLLCWSANAQFTNVYIERGGTPPSKLVIADVDPSITCSGYIIAPYNAEKSMWFAFTTNYQRRVDSENRQEALCDKMQDNSINMRTNFDKSAKKCNVYDEAGYCQQIVVDQRLNLAAVSYRCECPDGWRCPSHITDTAAHSECQFDEAKFWHRCQLRCTPVDTE